MITKFLSLKSYSKSVSKESLPLACLLFCVILIVLMLYPLVFEVFRFFFPLLLSTGICLTSACQLILPNDSEGMTNFEVNEDGRDRLGKVHLQDHLRFSKEAAHIDIQRVSRGNPSADGSYHLTVKVIPVANALHKHCSGCEEQNTTSWAQRFSEDVWNCY